MQSRHWGATTALMLAVATGLSASTGAVHAAVAKKKPVKKAPAGSTSSIAQGKSLVTASGCAGCHKIGGKGGTTGPDLSHVGAQASASQIAEKIKNPKAKNPKSIMPASNRSDKQIAAMAAYLASLK